MIKLIVSDLDGTLLSSDKTISNNNLEAIIEAKKRGVDFMIATGREFTSVKEIMEKHQLSCETILMNGAQYRNEEGVISKDIVIREEVMRPVLDILQEHDMGALYSFSDYSYAVASQGNFQERIIRRFQDIQPPIDKQVIQKLVGEGFWKKVEVLPTMEDLHSKGEHILKIELFDFREESFARVQELLESHEEITVIPYGNHSMEITHATAQKGMMLEYVMEQLGLTRDEILVLGDGLNDISMFTMFPHSVVMENADPAVRKHASYVTGTNMKDGVAQAIRKYVLAQ